MSISNVRAKFGLSFTAAPTREGVNGSTIVGIGNADLRLATGNQGGVARIILAPGHSLEWDFSLHAPVDTPSWTGGTAQVETATAAGTITVSGNATVIVTSAGMTGSPKTITFAVTSGDTATQWAVKARAALAADPVIAERFDVTGSTTSVGLIRKAIVIFYDRAGGDIPIYAGDDATLNIALADDTSTGITEAATSTPTTAGVATAGFKSYDDSVNYEGRDYIEPDNLLAFEARSNYGEVVIASTEADAFKITLEDGGRACLYKAVSFTTADITAGATAVDLEYCIAGFAS